MAASFEHYDEPLSEEFIKHLSDYQHIKMGLFHGVHYKSVYLVQAAPFIYTQQRSALRMQVWEMSYYTNVQQQHTAGLPPGVVEYTVPPGVVE